MSDTLAATLTKLAELDHPPMQVTMFWCPSCKSLFRFDVGPGHLPHKPGIHGKCESKLKPTEFFS